MIKLIVGLGNPGPRYHGTRHNAGAQFVEQVAEQYHATLKPTPALQAMVGKTMKADCDLLLAINTTFMNLSGQAVQKVAHYFKIQPTEILVVHDELDLPPGTVRLKKGGGHGGHNGLRNIFECLGTQDFYRLRIGIGHPGRPELVSDFVLHTPTVAEHQNITRAQEKALSMMPLLCQGKVAEAMQNLHSD